MGVKRAARILTDADIPAAIARDAETADAVAAHVSALHPFPIFGFGQNVSSENVFDSGSGFLDCRDGGGNRPPGMGHIQGFQARFAYLGGKWGMQLVTQHDIDDECYFRTVSANIWRPWRRIWNDGNFNPANYLQISQGDGRYRQSAVALTDADIPAAIARDTEVTATVAAHLAAADPHSQYLLPSEGDARYRQSAVALVDTDIPATIARDTEYIAADAAHVAAADPHPSLWSRIVNAFLALTGGQTITKNNPAPSPVSFAAGQNHLELRTTDGSNPILGFHRTGFTATALYHAGYGSESLRIRNADGYDSQLLHKVNHLDVPGFHSVLCTLISTTVAAVGTETVVGIGTIPAEKIVSISAQILDSIGATGIFFILKGGGGDFSPNPRLQSGSIRIPPVTASQLVGDPLHILVWHIP